MKQGDKLKLTVSIAPAKASKLVTWKTSNKNIATVDAKGYVTAKKAGTVKITAVAKDGTNKKAVCTVKIAKKAANKAANKVANYSIKTNVSDFRIEKGKSKTITITVGPKAGGVSTNLSAKYFDWKWGKWKGDSVTLKVTGTEEGTFQLKLWNTNKKSVSTTIKITVFEKHPWDNVEVIAPASFGDDDEPANRAALVSYNFVEGYDAKYKMFYKVRAVKHGNTGRTSWGSYANFYDTNGNIIDHTFVYFSSFYVGAEINDYCYVPKETKRIVFEEYPEPITQPSSTTSVVEEKDETLWTYSEAKDCYDYSKKANAELLDASKQFMKISKSNRFFNAAYYGKAKLYVQNGRNYLVKARDIAAANKEISVTNGSTLVELIDEAIAKCDKFLEVDLTSKFDPSIAFDSSSIDGYDSYIYSAGTTSLGCMNVTLSLMGKFLE